MQYHQRHKFTESYMFQGQNSHVLAYLHTEFPLGMHNHDYYEMNIVTAGEGIHCFGSHECMVKAGDVFLIPPQIYHGYYRAEGLAVHHILFSNAFFRDYKARLSEFPQYTTLFEIEPNMRDKQVFPSCGKKQLQELLYHAQMLPDREQTLTDVEALTADARAILLLAVLFRWQAENVQTKDNRKNAYAVLQVMEYITRHYGEKITLEQLYRQTNMPSMPTFLRCFRSLCGKSPISYVISVRLAHAEAYLKNTDMPLTQIAYECGFYDSSQFSKLFYKAYGCTPSHYRQQG